MILCVAVELVRSLFSNCFCTGPSIVRLGSFVAARQPAAGLADTHRLNGKELRMAAGRVGPRSPPQIAATFVLGLRHERWSVMNSSTSLPHLTARYSGSPAHDGSCGSPVSRIGLFSKNACIPAA